MMENLDESSAMHLVTLVDSAREHLKCLLSLYKREANVDNVYVALTSLKQAQHLLNTSNIRLVKTWLARAPAPIVTQYRKWNLAKTEKLKPYQPPASFISNIGTLCDTILPDIAKATSEHESVFDMVIARGWKLVNAKDFGGSLSTMYCVCRGNGFFSRANNFNKSIDFNKDMSLQIKRKILKPICNLREQLLDLFYNELICSAQIQYLKEISDVINNFTTGTLDKIYMMVKESMIPAYRSGDINSIVSKAVETYNDIFIKIAATLSGFKQAMMTVIHTWGISAPIIIIPTSKESNIVLTSKTFKIPSSTFPLPQLFICPITRVKIDDPIKNKNSQMVYEKKAYEQWMQFCNVPKCPKTASLLFAVDEDASMLYKKNMSNFVSLEQTTKQNATVSLEQTAWFLSNFSNLTFPMPTIEALQRCYLHHSIMYVNAKQKIENPDVCNSYLNLFNDEYKLIGTRFYAGNLLEAFISGSCHLNTGLLSLDYAIEAAFVAYACDEAVFE